MEGFVSIGERVGTRKGCRCRPGMATGVVTGFCTYQGKAALKVRKNDTGVVNGRTVVILERNAYPVDKPRGYWFCREVWEIAWSRAQGLEPMYQLFTDDGISATIKVKGYPTVTKSGYDGLELLHWAEEVMVRVFAQKLTGTLVSIAEVMETLGDFNIDAVYGDRLSIIDDSGFRNFVREEV